MGKLLLEPALDGFPFTVATGNLDGVAGDGESIPVRKGVAEVAVPAGSLRILEAVTIRRPQ